MSNSKEQLHDCPKCGRKNFTAGGLRAHACRPLTLETLAVLPPVAGSEDAVMGRQLTEQWERVKASRREDLIFGAMMLKVRERCECVSARGHTPFSKGDGVKGWLDEHAPTVSRSVAYRLMEIAEGVKEDFALKKIDLEALLTAQVEGLDSKLAAKRAKIEEVIEGKSQRQLLLEFGSGEAKDRGGHREKKESGTTTGMTPEEQEAAFLAACRDDFTTPFLALDKLSLNGRWKAPTITDGERDDAIACIEKLAKKMKAWLQLPQKKRSGPSHLEEAEGSEA